MMFASSGVDAAIRVREQLTLRGTALTLTAPLLRLTLRWTFQHLVHHVTARYWSLSCDILPISHRIMIICLMCRKIT